MKVYCIIGFTCAAILSILFLLLAPEKYTRFTLCLYGGLSLFVICMLLIIAGETKDG